MLPILLSSSLSLILPKYLTDKNFDQFSSQTPLMILLVPARGFETQFIPQYRALTQMYGDKIAFTVLATGESQEVYERYELTDHLSIHIFKNGRYITEYTGKYDTKDMSKYIKQMINPVLKLETDQEAFDYLQETQISVILCDDTNNMHALDKFTEAAEELSPFVPFVHATTSEAILKVKKTDNAAVVLKRNIDQETIILDIDEINNIIPWVQRNIKPNYYTYSQHIMRRIEEDKRATFLSFVDTTRKKHMKTMHAFMKNAVRTFRQNFTYMYFDRNEYKSIAEELGFPPTRHPVCGLFNFTENNIVTILKYPENYLPTVDGVTNYFMNYIIKNDLIPIRSEPIPDAAPGPLKKVVGRTFRNFTNNKSIDTLFLFTTGDDGDIRRAMTKTNIVAREFSRQKVKTVRFCYLDFDNNDTPGLKRPNIMEPTFILFRSGSASKNPLLFKADGEIGEIMQTIMSNVGTEISFRIPDKYDL